MLWDNPYLFPFLRAIELELRQQRKASPAEFRRQCEECKRLAMDATPMTEVEREQLERELQGRGSA